MSAGGEAVRHEKPASTRLFLAVVASGVFVTVITATMINVLITTNNWRLSSARS